MSEPLKNKTKVFVEANTTYSLFEVVVASIGYFGSVFMIYYAFTQQWWSVYFVSCLLASLFMVKVFCLLHDCTHGSLFRSTWLNNWVGRFLSLFITMPFTSWKIEHEEHHSHVVDMEKIDHGDIPLLTVSQYKSASAVKKLLYRIFRHPIFFLVVSPFIYFFIKARFPSIWKKQAIISVLLTNIAIALIYIPLLLHFGFWIMLFVFAPAAYLGGIIGLALFYLQHDFPEAEWFKTSDWSYEEASLHGSSLIILPQPLEWFSHAIGYHHIHHLNSSIPGYRLKECYQQVKEFQCITPLTWSDIIQAFKLKLWSYEKNTLVTMEESERLTT